MNPKELRDEEVGGAREGLERSPLPPMLDKEGKLEKFERHCPTPENAEAGENDCSCSLVNVIGEWMVLLMDMGEWIELLTDMGAMGEGYIQIKSHWSRSLLVLWVLVMITSQAHG